MSDHGPIQRANSFRSIRLFLNVKGTGLALSFDSDEAYWCTSFQIFFSLWRGHRLLALLCLLLCSVPGHYPLANFCLLVWREHLENLAIL